MPVTWQDIVISLAFKLAALYVILNSAGHRVRRLYMKNSLQKYSYMNSCSDWSHYV
jgi:hypothetical protein